MSTRKPTTQANPKAAEMVEPEAELTAQKAETKRPSARASFQDLPRRSLFRERRPEEVE